MPTIPSNPDAWPSMRTLFNIPGISTSIRQMATNDAHEVVYMADFPADYKYENHLIGNAKRRARRRGLIGDAYILYVSFFLDAYIHHNPMVEDDSLPANESYIPFVEADSNG